MAKVVPAARLMLSFLVELVKANWAVVRIVLQPRLAMRPGIIAYQTSLETDLAKTWLANLITLTPGTLTLFISEDRHTLYIHTIDIDDPSAVKESIRTAFESKLLELER